MGHPTEFEPELIETDAELVRRVQTNEIQAFDELVGRYQEDILKFLVQGVGNPDDAEDLAQDVFIDVFKSLHNFMDKGNTFKCWLFKIAVNKKKHYWKEHYRHQHILIDVAAEASDDPPIDTIIDVKEARSVLSEKQQQALILYYDECVTYKEISRRMEIPLIAAYRLVEEAINRLREIFTLVKEE